MWMTKEVLAQFYPAMCKVSGLKCRRINIWDGEKEAKFIVQGMEHVKNIQKFWQDLEVLSSPNDIDFEVVGYITAAPPEIMQTRIDWLYEKGFPIAPVIFNSNKVEAMRSLCANVLIDDRPKNLEKIAEAGFTPIQFVPFYMSEIYQKYNPVVHLSQVSSVLDRLNGLPYEDKNVFHPLTPDECFEKPQ